MTPNPNRLFVSNDDFENYKRIRDSGEFPMFHKRTNVDLFIYAMGVGVKYGKRETLKNRHVFVEIRDIRPDYDALIKSAAFLGTGELTVITDQAECFKIAEEYAHGGITFLMDELERVQHGTYEKKLLANLIGEYKITKPFDG